VLLEVGALGQILVLLDREEAITNPDGLLPLDVLKHPAVRSSLISRRGGGASIVDPGGVWALVCCSSAEDRGAGRSKS
jgi:hypothetical protein